MSIGSVNNTNTTSCAKKDVNISRNQIGDSTMQSIFSRFDKDGDGKLNSCNKNGFDEIAALNEEYKKLPNDNSEDTNLIKLLFQRVVNFIKGNNKNKVFVDGKEVKPNGEVDENVKQGDVGDCWLLAQVNALNDTEYGRAAIKEAITPNKKNGTYTVKFKGSGDSYVITAQELQDAIDSGKYSSGDPDMVLIELAAEKHYDKDSEYSQRTRSIEGGYSDMAEYPDFKLDSEHKRDFMYLLTGNKSHSYSDKENINASLSQKADNDSSVAMTFGTHYNIRTGEPFDEGGHEITISNVEKDANGNIKSVTVVDPWDNNEEITLSYEDFMKYCDNGVNVNTNNSRIEEKLKSLDANSYDKYINESVDKLTNINGDYDWVLGLSTDNIDIKREIIRKAGGVRAIAQNIQSHNPTEADIKEKEIAEQEKFERFGADEYMENYIKENGLEELYNSDDMKEEQKREFIAHFNKPLEQRVQERLYKNKNMIYEVLNFTQDEIKSINENPDTLKEICEKYGFAY